MACLLIIIVYTSPILHCCCVSSTGLIERPMNTMAEIGQLVTFTCTYRSPEPPENSININYFNLPPVNSSLSTRSIDGFTQQGTLSFRITSDFSPAVSSGYQCTISIGNVTLSTTEPVNLTVSCKFTTYLSLTFNLLLSKIINSSIDNNNYETCLRLRLFLVISRVAT